MKVVQNLYNYGLCDWVTVSVGKKKQNKRSSMASKDWRLKLWLPHGSVLARSGSEKGPFRSVRGQTAHLKRRVRSLRCLDAGMCSFSLNHSWGSAGVPDHPHFSKQKLSFL